MNANTNRHWTLVPLPTAIEVQPTKPEFVRLPRPRERCPLTGMSRSTLSALVVPCKENDFKPPVKSYVLRQRGKLRGVRLIDYDSLMHYIRSRVEPRYEEPKPQ